MNKFEGDILSSKEARSERGPSLEHIYPDPSEFFDRFTAMHDCLPDDHKIVIEKTENTNIHISFTRINRNGIAINKTRKTITGAGEFITRQAAIVIQGDSPDEVFYGIRVRSGLADTIDQSDIVERNNEAYSEQQVGLLLTTTEQIFKRQYNSVTLSDEGIIFDVETTPQQSNSTSLEKNSSDSLIEV